MKKIYLGLLLLPFLGRAQQGFVINGNVTGLPDKSVVAVVNGQDPTDTIAQARAVAGKFMLKGSVAEPGLYTLNFTSQKKTGLFLDNSTLSVSGSADDLPKLVMTGSPSQRDFQDLQTTFDPLLKQLNGLEQQRSKAGMTPQLQTEAMTLISKIQSEVDHFIQQKKDSYVSPFLLLVTAQLTEDPAKTEARFAGLTTRVQNGMFGQQLKTTIDRGRVGRVGTPAIDFTQNDATGKPVSLSSFKGKYVLVDFWASWCGPCRMENPNVVKTYQKYKDKNFTVLGVSLDRSKDPWLKAIQDDKLAWTQVSDLKFWSNEVARAYGIESIPQNFLIDPKGVIIARDLRGEALSAKLGELLK